MGSKRMNNRLHPVSTSPYAFVLQDKACLKIILATNSISVTHIQRISDMLLARRTYEW